MNSAPSSHKSVAPGAQSSGGVVAGGREAPRLIALDLDGTLLDSQKRITPRTLAALEAAAARGIHIVPTTGRFFDGMPACVRDLPFVRYAVTINGAAVFDRAKDTVIAGEEIPISTTFAILDVFARHDVIYNCYMDNAGWIPDAVFGKVDHYIPDFYHAIIRSVITPVANFREWLTARGHSVQKLIAFSHEPDVLEAVRRDLEASITGIRTTYSNSMMLEVNAEGAHKGRALALLAAHLGFGMEHVMAFGDGLNDLTMVRDAGVGVAMANAEPEVLAAAKVVTASNDEDGVALAIERMLTENR